MRDDRPGGGTRRHASFPMIFVGVALVASTVTPVWSGEACPAFDHRHGGLTMVLQRHVRDGSVDYAALKAGGAVALDRYLDSLRTVSAGCRAAWTRSEQLAFWVNAYNAYTIRLILDHHPVDSIRSIGWLPGAAFRTRFIPVDGLERTPLSLDDVEHGIIRPRFQDARVHFALVCASKGCPPLRAAAYRAEAVERQLDEQTRAFVNDPGKNRFDAGERVLRLSSIFKWFAEDFERSAGGVRGFLARYAEEPMAGAAGDPAVPIEYLEYDWSLNGR